MISQAVVMAGLMALISPITNAVPIIQQQPQQSNVEQLAQTSADTVTVTAAGSAASQGDNNSQSSMELLAQIDVDLTLQTKTKAANELESLNQGLYMDEEQRVLAQAYSSSSSSAKCPEGKETSAPSPKVASDDKKKQKAAIGELAQISVSLTSESELSFDSQETFKQKSMALAQVASGALAQSQAMAKLQTFKDSAVQQITQTGESVYNYVAQIDVKDASSPVSQAHALFLLVFSVMSIVGCCASTTICVRAARDSNIAMNALNIRRKYHRNMQLYMLVREKMMVERNVSHQLANGSGGSGGGFTNSSMTESRSLTEDQDDEASSSFASSSMDASVSYDNGHGHGGAVGLINPSDMIMEQSNDDDDSYVDQRPRRVVDLIGDQENISLIEDDYVIVDPITEQYRADCSSMSRKSFFEENLLLASGQNEPHSAKSALSAGMAMTMAINSNASSTPIAGGGSQQSPQVNVHVSQLTAVDLTDCSEEEKEDDESNQSFDSQEHFQVEGGLTEAEGDDYD